MKRMALCMLACWSMANAQQNTPVQQDINNIIENIAGTTESESNDFIGLQDDAERLLREPIDINSSEAIRLLDLQLITPIQYQALQQYIAQHGNLLAVYELQAIREMDDATVRSIADLVRVRDGNLQQTFRELFSSGRHTIAIGYSQVIEKSRAYRERKYAGPPFRLLLRYRFQAGSRFSVAFNAEKDAGEEFFSGSNRKGFDFYSGHIFYRGKKWLRAIALGDYEVKLGQGLIAWSGFGFGKSPAVLNVCKTGQGLRAYSSVNEVNFMRGAAAHFSFNGFHLLAFGSFFPVDASTSAMTDTSGSFEENISSFLETGYHRTAGEIASRLSVNRLTAGGSVGFENRKWRLAANVVYTRFFNNVSRKLYPYSQFDFNQSYLLNASLDYRAGFRNVLLFGETAVSDNRGFGTVNGALISLHKSTTLSVVQRYFSKDLQTLYANTFSESSRPQNENGVYFGAAVTPVRILRIEAYADLFMFPWLRYLSDAPSWGTDAYAQVTLRPTRKLNTYLRYRYLQKQTNYPDNRTALDFLTEKKQHNLRWQLSFETGKRWMLNTRIEQSFFRLADSREYGSLVYQDVEYRPLSVPVSVSSRFALFRTSSYNTRIYAFEDDVPYSFSIPAYYGQGMRFYLMLRVKPYRGLDAIVRFSQTHRFDQQVIGSGNDEINAPHKSEVKAMLRYSF